MVLQSSLTNIVENADSMTMLGLHHLLRHKAYYFPRAASKVLGWNWQMTLTPKVFKGFLLKLLKKHRS